MEGYRTIAAPAQEEFVEKRSRFIGQIAPVEGEEEALATLCFNLNNDLVRRILDLTDPEALEDVVRVLYVQALLAGGHPLRGQELRMMNEGILGLLGRGI